MCKRFITVVVVVVAVAVVLVVVVVVVVVSFACRPLYWVLSGEDICRGSECLSPWAVSSNWYWSSIYGFVKPTLADFSTRDDCDTRSEIP